MNPIDILLMNTVTMLQLALSNGHLTHVDLENIAGQASNALMVSKTATVFAPLPQDTIFMADPRGSVVPTTTIEATEIPRSFIPAAPMYDVFKQPKP